MKDKKFIPALTGITAICVYLIFLKHLNFFSLIGIFIISLSIILLFLIARTRQLPNATDIWQGLAINNILMPVGITILFYSLIYHKSQLQEFLGSKIMVQLGYSTYFFYLLHNTFVLSYIFKFISHNIFIAFISVIIFSYIFFKLVEEPIAEFLKRKLIKKHSYNSILNR